MGWLTILLQFLPTILRILGILFGGGAAASFVQLQGYSPDGSVSLTDPATLQFVGGYSVAAVTALAAAGGVSSWHQRRLARSVDWNGALSRVQGINFLALIRLVVRIMQLVRSDSEASQMFRELFGDAAASEVQRQGHELLSEALRRAGRE